MSQLSGRPGSPGSEAPESDAQAQALGAAPVHETVLDDPSGVSAGHGAGNGVGNGVGRADEGDSGGSHDIGGSSPDDDDERPRSFVDTVVAGVKELLIVVVLAMGLSFIVKTWFFQAFYIPSGSMEDTLLVDDRVIVSKLTPGPFDLKRGDVVVFEDPLVPEPWLQDKPEKSTLGGPLHDTLVFVGLLPEDSENHLIKRVIGLPGDHVESAGGGKLKVNGVEVTEPYIKPGDMPSDMAFDIVVPEGKVWVMGDHRSDSADSRYHPQGGDGTTGSVPMDKIVGRALFVVWPFDHVTWLGTPERTFAKVPNPTPGVKPKPSGTAPGNDPVTEAPNGNDTSTPDKTPTK